MFFSTICAAVSFGAVCATAASERDRDTARDNTKLLRNISLDLSSEVSGEEDTRRRVILPRDHQLSLSIRLRASHLFSIAYKLRKPSLSSLFRLQRSRLPHPVWLTPFRR